MSARDPMTTVDMNRIRGDAPPSTHLARFERAHEVGVSRVLRVICPYCGARVSALCKEN